MSPAQWAVEIELCGPPGGPSQWYATGIRYLTRADAERAARSLVARHAWAIGWRVEARDDAGPAWTYRMGVPRLTEQTS